MLLKLLSTKEKKTVQRKEKWYFFSYTKNCKNLLVKFTAAYRQIEGDCPKIEEFVRKYRVKLCSADVYLIWLFLARLSSSIAPYSWRSSDNSSWRSWQYGQRYSWNCFCKNWHFSWQWLTFVFVLHLAFYQSYGQIKIKYSSKRYGKNRSYFKKKEFYWVFLSFKLMFVSY